MSTSGSVDQDSYKRDRSRSPMDRKPAVSNKRGKKNTGKRVSVSNIPYEYKWQDLKDLFRQQVGEVNYVELFKDDAGRPRGAGVIEFANEETAQKAIEKMHRYEIGDRSIIVKEDTGDSRKDRGSSSSGGSRFSSGMQGRVSDMSSMNNMSMMNNMSSVGNMGMSNLTSNSMQQSNVNYGNTYGLSVSFLESLGVNGPLVNRVFVANLDYTVDEEKLTEVFKIAGKVQNVELSKDPETNKSRGFGVVEFDHPVEAVQAISMLHGQWYYERKMSVRMDRVFDGKRSEKQSAPKLPPGLKGIGFGLGNNGSPLTDVSSLSTNSLSMNTANMGMGMPSNNMGMSNSMGSSGGNMMGSGMSNMASMNQMGMGGGMGGMGNNDMGMMGGQNTGMAANSMMAAMAGQLNTSANRGINGRFASGNSRFSR